MKKSVLCILLVLAMIAGFAFAETPVKSVTVTDIVSPSGVTFAENFTVYLPPIEPETVEAVVFEEIAAVVEAAEVPVVEYFPAETVAAIVEKLPENVVAEDLQLDEFFPLKEMGYEEHYGAVEVEFEFATQYKDDDVVIALVGILGGELNLENEESFRDERGIVWTPMDTAINQGKVRVTFTEEVLKGVQQGTAMMALLRNGKIVE